MSQFVRGITARIVSACALLMVLVFDTISTSVADIPAGLVEGASAPEFVRHDTQGRIFRLSDLRGKVVLVDFWASWCTPCLLEIPHLIRLQEQYGPKGLRIVGISMDESRPALRRAMARFTFNYPVVGGDAK